LSAVRNCLFYIFAATLSSVSNPRSRHAVLRGTHESICSMELDSYLISENFGVCVCVCVCARARGGEKMKYCEIYFSNNLGFSECLHKYNLYQRPDWSCFPSTFLSTVYQGALPPGTKRPKYEAECPLACNTKFKNAQSFTSISPYVFVAWCLGTRKNVTFSFM